MPPLIRLIDVNKTFDQRVQTHVAIDRFSLDIEAGSFVTFVGRSGCGKSTILNMLAGLIAPSDGTIEYDGARVRGPNAAIGYLTQKDTLLPWRDVEANIALPLEIRHAPKASRAARAKDLLRRVGLEGFEKRYPRELSGGMQRRASLARMLANDPKTLLMDEPFGALDAQLRMELQNELLDLWSGSGKTVVFVTHDLEEAIALGDRIVVLGPRGAIVLDERVVLPRPRDVAKIRLNPEFMAIHARLWDALMSMRMPAVGEEHVA